jgi:hypothetical protein
MHSFRCHIEPQPFRNIRDVPSFDHSLTKPLITPPPPFQDLNVLTKFPYLKLFKPSNCNGLLCTRYGNTGFHERPETS